MIEQIIHVPKDRPHCCAECPLLGKRPARELREGDRYTMMCCMPEHMRPISGRGTHQQDPRNRYRCKPVWWEKMVGTHSGDIPIANEAYQTYKLYASAWLYERDTRINRETL